MWRWRPSRIGPSGPLLCNMVDTTSTKSMSLSPTLSYVCEAEIPLESSTVSEDSLPILYLHHGERKVKEHHRSQRQGCRLHGCIASLWSISKGLRQSRASDKEVVVASFHLSSKQDLNDDPPPNLTVTEKVIAETAPFQMIRQKRSMEVTGEQADSEQKKKKKKKDKKKKKKSGVNSDSDSDSDSEEEAPAK
eukprot:scaffold13617_cov84-Skeletonema_marinoi.AAC.10